MAWGFHFWLTRTKTDIRHLYVAVTEPRELPLRFAIVNFSSLKTMSDTTVVVPSGCHPRLPLQSFVMYRFASVTEISNLEKALSANLFLEVEPFVDPILIKRMQLGIAQSPHTPRDVVRFCKAAGII